MSEEKEVTQGAGPGALKNRRLVEGDSGLSQVETMASTQENPAQGSKDGELASGNLSPEGVTIRPQENKEHVCNSPL